MTLLIHLEYLEYIADDSMTYIPNNEVRNTFIDSVETSNLDLLISYLVPKRNTQCFYNH